VKQYEHTKFVLPEFSNDYYSEKAKYLIAAFAKDFKDKIEEISPN
jgi:hypothetical protein